MANKIENRHCVENEQFASYKDPLQHKFCLNLWQIYATIFEGKGLKHAGR